MFVSAIGCKRECGPLTDDVHLADVQTDLREGGDASSCVVSPTVTVFSSGAIGGTLGGIIEPGIFFHLQKQENNAMNHFDCVEKQLSLVSC